jgi:glycosyltransferase involved in cell wall biosynthesis
MPKILQINSLVNKGSTGRIVEQIGNFFISNGWQSYIAFGRSSNESKSKTIKIGNEFDHILHGIKSRLLDKHGLSSSNATRNLIKKIIEIKPDIIHLHNLHGYYLNYEILFNYFRTIKTPIVWTLHDCWSITGHCTFFSDINCNKWKSECNNCPKLKNYPTSIFIDNSLINFNLKKKKFNSIENLTLVPVSHWLGQIIKQSFLQDYEINVIQNGVDLKSFYYVDNSDTINKKYSIDGKKILLGVATTWDARKGIMDYYKLAKVISSEYVILLVGLTKKQIELLPNNIIGIERTESIDELKDLYSSAEIVLNLSYQESFGLTTVEGFACGTPSIVYNCTASPELVTPETGIVVEPGNIESLVIAINTIANNGKSFYTKNCRKLAENKYNNEVKIAEYFKLAQTLTNNT